MVRLRNASTRSGAGPILGTLGALGLTIAFVALRRSKRRQGDQDGDKRRAVATYLREHLAGADTAIQIVHDLSDAYRGGPEGALFASLYEQFREDRGVVEKILAELGYTSRSVKRLAGRATGSALGTVAGGAPAICRCSGRSRRSPSACRASDVCGEPRRRLSRSHTRQGDGALSNWKRMPSASGRPSSGSAGHSYPVHSACAAAYRNEPGRMTEPQSTSQRGSRWNGFAIAH
jgi:hypothetical protein